MTTNNLKQSWMVDLHTLIGLAKHILNEADCGDDAYLAEFLLEFINDHKGSPVIIKEYNS